MGGGTSRRAEPRSHAPSEGAGAAEPAGAPRAPAVDEAPGQMGPGVGPSRRIDPTLVTAWIFALLGYTPYTLWERLLGFGFFGPIQVPAILAMVGVLFGFIAVLRALDLQDRTLRILGGTAAALGLVRLFLLPFF